MVHEGSVCVGGESNTSGGTRRGWEIEGGEGRGSGDDDSLLNMSHLFQLSHSSTYGALLGKIC